ncbi:MAG TPA: hypothetical protein VGL07_16940 [Buttiauxella sp.]|jgi:hypothetical protein
MSNKPIFAAVLNTTPCQYATAVYASESQTLHFMGAKTLPKSRKEMDAVLKEELSRYAMADAIILIDEAQPRISRRYGSHCRLGSIDIATGKPVIVVALEHYKELGIQQAISFPDCSGRYDIPASIVDEDRDGKGEAMYRINWPEVTPEIALLLLAVYGISYNDVSSIGYLKKMFGGRRSERTPSVIAPLVNTLSAYDKLEAERLAKLASPLTGKGNIL